MCELCQPRAAISLCSGEKVNMRGFARLETQSCPFIGVCVRNIMYDSVHRDERYLYIEALFEGDHCRHLLLSTKDAK
jgi:hypothetical protein